MHASLQQIRWASFVVFSLAFSACAKKSSSPHQDSGLPPVDNQSSPNPNPSGNTSASSDAKTSTQCADYPGFRKATVDVVAEYKDSGLYFGTTTDTVDGALKTDDQYYLLMPSWEYQVSRSKPQLSLQYLTYAQKNAFYTDSGNKNILTSGTLCINDSDHSLKYFEGPNYVIDAQPVSKLNRQGSEALAATNFDRTAKAFGKFLPAFYGAGITFDTTWGGIGYSQGDAGDQNLLWPQYATSQLADFLEAISAQQTEVLAYFKAHQIKRVSFTNTIDLHGGQYKEYLTDPTVEIISPAAGEQTSCSLGIKNNAETDGKLLLEKILAGTDKDFMSEFLKKLFPPERVLCNYSL